MLTHGCILKSCTCYRDICSLAATVGLDEEQTALYDSARSFADRELAPFMKEWDEKQIFPVDTMRKAAELGMSFLVLHLPRMAQQQHPPPATSTSLTPEIQTNVAEEF